MAITVVPVHDATHAGVPFLPAGQAAGYSTGSGDVPWTAADWAAHPGAVQIAQSPLEPADDAVQADVLDVERGAAAPAAVPGWYRSALAAWTAGTRPGQRYPAVYVSAYGVTAAVNALVSAGITAGPKLWLANWNLSAAAAAALVQAASGPFPVIGVQYASGPSWDTSVMSLAWLTAVSGPAPAPPPPALANVDWLLPVLARGASGDPVRTVQGLLGARGHLVVIDGQFGPATFAGVTALQSAAKITADGVVGLATWGVLAGVA